MSKQRKKYAFFPLIVCALVLLFLLGVGRQCYRLYLVHQETVKTQEQVQKLEAEKKQLEQEKQDLNDPKYLEKVAREEHNMVKKGEVPLFIVDEKGDSKNTNSSAQAQQGTDAQGQHDAHAQ